MHIQTQGSFAPTEPKYFYRVKSSQKEINRVQLCWQCRTRWKDKGDRHSVVLPKTPTASCQPGVWQSLESWVSDLSRFKRIALLSPSLFSLCPNINYTFSFWHYFKIGGRLCEAIHNNLLQLWRKLFLWFCLDKENGNKKNLAFLWWSINDRYKHNIAFLLFERCFFIYLTWCWQEKWWNPLKHYEMKLFYGPSGCHHNYQYLH